MKTLNTLKENGKKKGGKNNNKYPPNEYKITTNHKRYMDKEMWNIVSHT